MALFKREAKPASTPAATFFDASPSEETSAASKRTKARKTNAKAIPAESRPVQAVDSGVQLQTEIEHPHEAMMRALARVESQGRDEQPMTAERTATFRRPSLYNSLGLRSNGPMTFSTHPNEYDELYGREIAAERAEAKEKQERRAWAGLETLARMLIPAKRKTV
jgi:hypothetical protein